MVNYICSQSIQHIDSGGDCWMDFSENQIQMCKNLSLGSEFYQKEFIGDPIFIEQFENGFKALWCFLDYYAYARQGAPAAYPKIAKAVITPLKKSQERFF